MRRIVGLVVVLLIIVVAYVAGAFLHLYGRHEGPGEVTKVRVPPATVHARATAEAAAAKALAVPHAKEILFGDLHVHTTFSTDAFLWSLPMMQGDGAHPLADACDFARFCSALDFWSINDHAEASTPRRWRETREAIRQCNAVSGDPNNPDVAVFLGWEWSQVGRTPEEHYGHKNVIFKGLADNEVPARVIGAAGIATDGLRGSVGQMSAIVPLLDFPNRQRYFNFIQFMQEVRDVPLCPTGVNSRELPANCYESATTPRDLFDKLDQWGFDTIVIPHGNTWGYYSPPGITWDKQLTAKMDDAKKQFLIEIMSGHGNSEQYRDWRAVRFDDKGKPYCPEPSQNYLPSCWRAGEIIEQRCRDAGIDAAECASRAAEARQNYADMGIVGHNTVPGVEFEQWLDSGQCKDCFIPSFNYRPGGSTQYALAITNFDDPAHPRRFHFGIIASSDNHRARPGTGYKEFDRLGMTEANGPKSETWRKRIRGSQSAPEPRSTTLDLNQLASRGFQALEAERQASFFMTGGLVAVHADGRSRDAVWNALKHKEVYGTSGDRILLWFNLLNAPGPNGAETPMPMGSETRMNQAPRFEVRAVGAFKQKPGCPPGAAAMAVQGRVLQPVGPAQAHHPRRGGTNPAAGGSQRAGGVADRGSVAQARLRAESGRLRRTLRRPRLRRRRARHALLRARHRRAQPRRQRRPATLQARRIGSLSRGAPVLRRLPHGPVRRLPEHDRGACLVVADLHRSSVRGATPGQRTPEDIPPPLPRRVPTNGTTGKEASSSPFRKGGFSE